LKLEIRNSNFENGSSLVRD